MKQSLERLLGISLVVAGIGCTSAYVHEQVQQETARQDGVEQFESMRAQPDDATTEPIPAHADDRGASMATRWHSAARAADTSDWAPGRIEAWHEAQRGESALPIALLDIPALGLEVPVYEGADGEQIDLGVGRIAGTTRIGQQGNIGLSSHRDGYFRALQHIEIGDRIRLAALDGSVREYEVHELSVIEPEDVHVLYPQGDDRVTLVTCYPFYFVGPAPQRFIVAARRVPEHALDTDAEPLALQP